MVLEVQGYSMTKKFNLKQSQEYFKNYAGSEYKGAKCY